MFRSGTTLMARMLNSHSSISIASDPFAPIFKCFRNEIVFKKMSFQIESESPLHDYFFDKNQHVLFKIIQNIDFRIPLEKNSILKIREKVKNHCIPYSPKIIDHLDLLDGKNFEDLLRSGFKIVDKAYGLGNEKIIGIKEVWTSEFIPCFFKSFPNLKIIILTRDPRAVCASNYATKINRYPFTFLCRQWRKLAIMGMHYNKKYKNVYFLKFEDLIQNPKKISNQLCDFLEIKFEESLINPDEFIDGLGKKWKQNSSYKNSSSGFTLEVLNKWERILNNDQIKYIEALCLKEMIDLKYNTSFIKEVEMAKKSIYNFNENIDGLAKWILPFYKEYLNKNDAKEIFRLNHPSQCIYEKTLT